MNFDEDGLATIHAPAAGIAYINREGKTAWAFPFDNGADYFVEGLARTRRDWKLGFINKSLDVVVEPVWDFAFPFEGGVAIVCQGCKRVPVCPGCEHLKVVDGLWGYIDRQGQIVVPVSHSQEALPPRPTLDPGRENPER
ncbi:MAG: WG repeat-containing protein [Acidobacteriota bacterium]